MGGSILIVDDNADSRKLLVFLLKKNGHAVCTASDATTALVALHANRPSLILMDVHLPGMGGLELTRLLKGNPETSDIFIVAVTACALKTDEDEALAAGCDGYLRKPIDTRSLPGVVAGWLASAPMAA